MKATLRMIGGAALAAAAYLVLLLVLAGLVRPWQELRRPGRNGLWASVLSGVVHAAVVILLSLALMPSEARELLRPLALTAMLAPPEQEIDVTIAPLEPVDEEILQTVKAGADDFAAPVEPAGGGDGALLAEAPVVDFRVEDAGTGFDRFKGIGDGLGREIGSGRYAAEPTEEAGEGDGDQGSGDKTTFFGTTARGRRMVFIVDSSGSMQEGQRFPRARAELIRCVDELKETQEFYVIFYNTHYYPMPARDLVAATPENRQTVINWIKQAEPNGGTNPLGALQLAERLDPDAIFLLTDGVFTNLGDVARFIQFLPEPRVPIHTISFVDRIGEPVLREIAKATGGRYTHVE